MVAHHFCQWFVQLRQGYISWHRKNFPGHSKKITFFWEKLTKRQRMYGYNQRYVFPCCLAATLWQGKSAWGWSSHQRSETLMESQRHGIKSSLTLIFLFSKPMKFIVLVWFGFSVIDKPNFASTWYTIIKYRWMY